MTEHNEDRQPCTGAYLQLALRKTLTGPSGAFELHVETQVEAGTFVVLAGPSGAGKTTILRLLAGFDRPDSGYVRLAGQVWSDVPSRRFIVPRKRSIGFVFQDYALFPNMTVRGNLDYALGRRAAPGEAMRLLELVRLDGLATAFPARLSGGQQQRLALIRALARRPRLLMLDEPLSALDPAMRRDLQDEVLRLHREFGTTSFMVSHDSAEIARMADRVLRLENGRIVQDGPPAKVLCGSGEGLRLRTTLLAGPDDSGRALILVDGQPLAIHLPRPTASLHPGQEVEVDLAAAAIRPA